jgi:hypothetical protein
LRLEVRHHVFCVPAEDVVELAERSSRAAAPEVNSGEISLHQRRYVIAPGKRERGRVLAAHTLGSVQVTGANQSWTERNVGKDRTEVIAGFFRHAAGSVQGRARFAIIARLGQNLSAHVQRRRYLCRMIVCLFVRDIFTEHTLGLVAKAAATVYLREAYGRLYACNVEPAVLGRPVRGDPIRRGAIEFKGLGAQVRSRGESAHTLDRFARPSCQRFIDRLQRQEQIATRRRVGAIADRESIAQLLHGSGERQSVQELAGRKHCGVDIRRSALIRAHGGNDRVELRLHERILPMSRQGQPPFRLGETSLRVAFRQIVESPEIGG